MNLFQSICLLFILPVLNLVQLDDPCNSAIKISNPLRNPAKKNTFDSVELCDSDLKPDTWYDLGGEITNDCVDINRCSTYSGIWYSGKYPKRDEIVTGQVCAKTDDVSCCGWTDTIKIKKCPTGYIYQLAIPECPMSYCVGAPVPCSTNEVLHIKEKVCLEISSLEKPILSKPYISANKVFDTFKATAFSVDCIIKSNNVVPNDPNRKLKVEVIFWMNDFQVRDIIADYPVDKVTLEESYLKGHMGKTLTCSAQLFYVSIKDGSQTTKTDVVTSEGYYFGINAVDSTGAVIKEIQLKQGVPVEIHLQSTFPITFGHCIKAVQCNVRKYSFTTKENKVSQNDCQINFETLLGELVYKSTTTIKLSAKVTAGIEHTRTLLVFNKYTHVSKLILFEGMTIPAIPIIVLEKTLLPTCNSIGDPHVSTFSGLKYDNYLTGDFDLLSTKHRRFQIQTRQLPCFNGPATCYCGVIAREGNNLVGVNSCDYRETPKIIEMMKDNVNPTASIKKVQNGYQIEFVSGISIKVSFYFHHKRRATYMNLYVNGLKHEEYDGMCAASSMRNLERHRIPYDQSFFKSQLPPCVNEVYNFPACKCIGKEEGKVSVVCDYNESAKDVKIVKFENICKTTKRKKRTTDKEIATSLTLGRNGRSTLTLDDLFGSIDHSIDNQTFTETTNMPLNEAKDHCAKTLKQSKYFEKCKEILKHKHEDIEQSCIADVQISGSADLADIYLNIYEEICLITISKEVEIIDGEPSPESRVVVKLLGDINATFTERQANASTPWVEEDNPCTSAIKKSNVLRSPAVKNTADSVELCDSDLQPNTWYDLGGEITNACVDINSCSTYSGIWYSGNYPKGDEIVKGKVCAKTDDVSCCGWTETIKIKKCPTGYIYQLAIPKCPMSYCVGAPVPCSKNEVFDEIDRVCIETSSLEKPILSIPYISEVKLYDNFMATAFSIDCIIKAKNMVRNAPNRKQKVEVFFWMNDFQVRDSITVDFPVDKVTLEESYLKGHIGKTLTCSAQLVSVSDDGSQSAKTDMITSDGFYFGINAVDSTGAVIKEIQLNQGVPVEIHLQSTFPITFGHCVYTDQCNKRKYSFTTKENKLSQNDCEIQFENPSGLLVSKSTTSIKLSAKVTLGIENNTLDNLAFNTHVSNETIFENFTIASIQVKVIDDKPQPTCYTTGDPHIVSFSGIRFNNYFAGDFNLLSTKHRRFQIQVRQIPCFGGTVSCNCGVIVREGNNVVGINSCDYRKNPMIIDLMRDNVNPSASISKIRNDYLIQFVSGISIKVNFFYDRAKQATYLNIYVNALKHEEYEGMCDAKKGSKIEPLSFKIPNEQSFFKDQLPPCVNEPYNFSSCKCIGNKEGPVSLVCDYDKPDTTIDIIKFDNICDLEKLLNGKIDWIIPRKTSEKDIANDLSLFDVFKTINNSIDHQIFKEIINMPMDKAQDHCSKALKQSKYFDKCKEILQEKYENIMQNCAEDAQLSGNLDVVQTYLNVYEEDCITTLGKQVVITGGNPSPNSDNVTKVIGEMNETFSEREANASTPWTEEEIPSLEKPILSEPYISAYKMYDTFNATAFSIDCILNSEKAVPVIINKKLKVEVIFKMNNMKVAKFEVDYPVDKVSLEESYLRGHIGKTLTCEARLFNILDDGSVSSKTDVVTSEGYYFGINAVDFTGTVLKEIQMQHGINKEIYFQLTFPISFGHCVYTDQCNLRKYTFATKDNNISLNYCHMQFDNPLGLLVYNHGLLYNIPGRTTHLTVDSNRP